MESPPSSTSAWSDAFILSDDSGFLLTSGSISSGSMSGESRTGYGQLPLEFQDSDCEDKSFSQTDSLDGMSDMMCGEHFNTLKKGPHWSESTKTASPIEPPLEFQDRPNIYDNIAEEIANSIITDATNTITHAPTISLESPPPILSLSVHEPAYVDVEPYATPHAPHHPSYSASSNNVPSSSSSLVIPTPYRIHPVLAPHPTYWSPEFLLPGQRTISPCSHAAATSVVQYHSYGHSHHGRPSSRSSLGSSRLSSSHNSLSVLPAGHQPDDSSFITQAVSHDTLTSGGSGSGSHAQLYSSHRGATERDRGGRHRDEMEHRQSSRHRHYRYYDEPVIIRSRPRRHTTSVASSSATITASSSAAISDLYTVPFDSDVYAVPVDTVATPILPLPTACRRSLNVTSATSVSGGGYSTPGVGHEKEKQLIVAPKRRRRNTTATAAIGVGVAVADRQERLLADKQHPAGGLAKGKKATTNSSTSSTRISTTTTYTTPKRHSVAGPSHAPNQLTCISTCAQPQTTIINTATVAQSEPTHMSLQEVRQYLQKFCTSASGSEVGDDGVGSSGSSATGGHSGGSKEERHLLGTNNNKYPNGGVGQGDEELVNGGGIVVGDSKEMESNAHKPKRYTFPISIKSKKVKDSCENVTKSPSIGTTILSCKPEKRRKTNGNSMPRLYSFKQLLCNMFRFRRIFSPDREEKPVSNGIISESSENILARKEDEYNNEYEATEEKNRINRALPPLPIEEDSPPAEIEDEEPNSIDFATSFRKVKDYGWYWGPLSSEGAEKILSNEPHGSFIVRDSSDDHYIFSLTFKLNDSVRHVRIDHDQGNFSFGSCTRFKSQTIVEFIQNAVEHSRSGRYLFFLHRRPVIGPVRVQLLHPVSRFKQTESLQHICRFVILKHVRKDLVSGLPLPRRIIDYLHAPQYYISERLLDVVANGAGVDGTIGSENGQTALPVVAQETNAGGNGEGRDSSAESSSNDAEVREVLARQVASQDNYVFEPRALGGATQGAIVSGAT